RTRRPTEDASSESLLRLDLYVSRALARLPRGHRGLVLRERALRRQPPIFARDALCEPGTGASRFRTATGATSPRSNELRALRSGTIAAVRAVGSLSRLLHDQ